MSVLYVIKSEAGPVKIGISKEPDRRLATLVQGQPFGAELMHVEAPPDGIPARTIEAAAHSILASKRRRGEWFDVTPAEAEDAIRAAIREAIAQIETSVAEVGTGKASAISLRVSDEVKAAAEKAADDDGRSLASYVERVLTLHLREKGYLPK